MSASDGTEAVIAVNEGGYRIVEPTDDEKKATGDARSFTRSYAKDSAALAAAVPAGVALLILAAVLATLVEGLRDGSHGHDGMSWLLLIAAVAVLTIVASMTASVLVARHHYTHPGEEDLFAYGGHLFSVSFLRDRKTYRDDRGIVRIDVVATDGCVGFHNAKDRTVWILPREGRRIHDVWRRGKRWDEERELCRALADKGMPRGADTDPYFGVSEQYRGFLERIGIPVEETTTPVDFLAGTWSPAPDPVGDWD